MARTTAAELNRRARAAGFQSYYQYRQVRKESEYQRHLDAAVRSQLGSRRDLRKVESEFNHLWAKTYIFQSGKRKGRVRRYDETYLAPNRLASLLKFQGYIERDGPAKYSRRIAEQLRKERESGSSSR